MPMIFLSLAMLSIYGGLNDKCFHSFCTSVFESDFCIRTMKMLTKHFILGTSLGSDLNLTALEKSPKKVLFPAVFFYQCWAQNPGLIFSIVQIQSIQEKSHERKILIQRTAIRSPSWKGLVPWGVKIWKKVLTCIVIICLMLASGWRFNSQWSDK